VAIPNFLFLLIVVGKGLQAWARGLPLKQTQAYFTLCFTYYLYTSLIKCMDVFLLAFEPAKYLFVLFYVLNIIFNINIVMPLILRYINFKKEQDSQEALMSKGDIITQILDASGAAHRKKSTNPFQGQRVKVNESMSTNSAYNGLSGGASNGRRESKSPVSNSRRELMGSSSGQIET
jgi:hypothetical protein